MQRYRTLEHTADIQIQAFGKTKEELFSNALFGMFDVIGAEFKKGKPVEREIEVASGGLEDLLVDFLSEALYESDINNEAYLLARFDKLSETKLKAILVGKKIKGFKEEIKAVTYHGLEIKKTPSGWEAKVLFDI